MRATRWAKRWPSSWTMPCGAAVLLASTSSCHILGLAPIPCDPAASVSVLEQCGPSNACVDSVCVAVAERSPLPRCDAAEPDVERAVHVAPLATKLGRTHMQRGALPAPDLALEPTPVAAQRVRQPLPQLGSDDDDDATARTFALGGEVTDARAPTGAFVLEALVRLPGTLSFAPLVTAADMRTGAGGTITRIDGWQLSTAQGAVLMLAGQHEVDVLGAPHQWMHLLCFVDAPAIDDGSAGPEAVVCAGDGEVPKLITPLRTELDVGPVSAGERIAFGRYVGQNAASDGAVAFVHLWDGDPLGLTPLTPAERIDALVDEARVRLCGYLGIDVNDAVGGAGGAPAARFLLLNTSSPRTVELLRDGERSLELVGRWPRVTMVDDAAALLFEPERQQLLPSDPCATTVTGPTDLDDACAVSQTVAQPLDAARYTLSAFVQTPSVAAPLTLTLGTATCTLADGAPSCSGGVAVVDEYADGWRRLALSFDHAGGDLDVVVDSTRPVWMAQLERGASATSPIALLRMGPQGQLVANDVRQLDGMVLDRVGLPRGEHGEVRLRLAAANEAFDAAPIALLDGAARGAQLTFLRQESGQYALLVSERSQLAFAERLFDATPGAAFDVQTTFGDFVACDGCANLDLTPVQWSQVLLGGGEEPWLLFSTDVTMAGAPPRRTTLDLDVLGTAPTACLDDTVPAVTLLSCRGAPCSEGQGIAWRGDDVVAEPSPIVDEPALRGHMSAPVVVSLADRDLAFTLRFRADGNGELLTLLDGSKQALLVSVAGPTLSVASPAGARVLGASLTPGAWHQLVCWLGDNSVGARCALNAGEIELLADVELDAASLSRVDVGNPDAAIASLRLYAPRRSADVELVNRNIGARVLDGFGMVLAPRASPVVAVEQREGPALIDLGRDGFALVGARWPRVVDVGTPEVAYAADAREADALTNDFSTFDADNLDVTAEPSSLTGSGHVVGVRATTTAGGAPATLTAAGISGEVSVFVRPAAGTRVSLYGADGARASATTDDTARDGWVRLAVHAVGEATLALEPDDDDDIAADAPVPWPAGAGGAASLALPQLDDVIVTAPSLDDAPVVEGLSLHALDLSNALRMSLVADLYSFPRDGDAARLFAIRGEGTTAQEEMIFSRGADGTMVFRHTGSDRTLGEFDITVPTGLPIDDFFILSWREQLMLAASTTTGRLFLADPMFLTGEELNLPAHPQEGLTRSLDPPLRLERIAIGRDEVPQP